MYLIYSVFKDQSGPNKSVDLPRIVCGVLFFFFFLSVNIALFPAVTLCGNVYSCSREAA